MHCIFFFVCFVCSQRTEAVQMINLHFLCQDVQITAYSTWFDFIFVTLTGSRIWCKCCAVGEPTHVVLPSFRWDPAVIRALNLQSLMGNRLPYFFSSFYHVNDISAKESLSLPRSPWWFKKDFPVSCFMLHFKLFIVNSNVYLRLSLMDIMHPFNCLRENCWCVCVCCVLISW